MAEILVKAISVTNADSVKDRRGCYKRGDPVLVKPDGHEWGSSEGLPKFIKVKLPGTSVATVEQYTLPWKRLIQFVVVSSTPATDTFRLRVEALAGTVNVNTNEGGITQAMVQAYLAKWNASFVSATAVSVTLDTVIEQAIKSEGFFGNKAFPLLLINQTNYTQAGGIHRMAINYSAVPQARRADLLILLTQLNGALISNNTGTQNAVVDFTRVDVRNKFERDLTMRLQEFVVRRRYNLSEAMVAEAEAAGGSVIKTPAELLAQLTDRTL